MTSEQTDQTNRLLADAELLLTYSLLFIKLSREHAIEPEVTLGNCLRADEYLSLMPTLMKKLESILE